MDDLIPTISDDEHDVPDLDAAEDSSNLESSEPPRIGQKRKRTEIAHKSSVKEPNNNKSSNQNKKKRKAQTVPERSSPSDAEDSSEAGEDDGALDPDFEFNLGDAEGGVVEGFDEGWSIPKKSNDDEDEPRKAPGIDEIIARRKLKEKGAQLNGHVDGEELDQGDQEDEFSDFGDQDDELLADDAFGMGAPNEESSDDEEDGADEEQDETDEQLEFNGSRPFKRSNGEAEDSDEESVAEPVPHPDDLELYGGPDENDDEPEDPREKAKRDAFFAPETVNDPSTLSKTESSFHSMSLSRPILKGLAAVGFTSPTPIQTKTVPIALLGKDVVGGAVTGSGKTAAFILPILERLLIGKKLPTTRVAILMPTRELAVQCYNVATKLASYTDMTFALIVGGLSLREQEQTLKKRPDVVIATPGRFIDHMRNTASFAVEKLEILVLDEADRMLEEGFADELNEVLSTIPRSRQTMLFSATMTEDVDKLIRVGLNQPVRLLVDAKQQTVLGLVQEFIKLRAPSKKESESDENDFRRLAYLLHLCSAVYTAKTIVFLPTKALAHRIKVLFALHGIKAAELHGSMSQEQRLAAISSFRDGTSSHLLATDLAARGLDIPRVETVINYTVPTSSTMYLHRVGRTARAGRSGVSVTLFAPKTAPSSTSSNKPKTRTKGKPTTSSNNTASERTLLRPIIRLARSQSAPIRTRTLPPLSVAELTKKVGDAQAEIDEVLAEEKEERLLAQMERDATKGMNMVRFEEEIKGRPRRTWFQGEKEKKEAKERGRDERMGVKGVGHILNGNGGTLNEEEVARAVAAMSKKKRKLSGKEKKKLESKDRRVDEGKQGWKKRKDQRVGEKKGVPKSKTKPKAGKKGSKRK